MKKLLIAVLFSVQCLAKTIRVVVMDTGISKYNQSQLCKDGHKDFTNTSINDSYYHGSHVSDTIQQYASNNFRVPMKGYKLKKVDYCQIIIKIWNPVSEYKTDDIVKMETDAFKYVYTLPDVDIINFSGGGKGYDLNEYKAVEDLLERNVHIVASAGNNSLLLGRQIVTTYTKGMVLIDNTYYPSMYDPRITIVGSVDKKGLQSRFSNYGPLVTIWELGEDILALDNRGKTSYLSGTSQATAVTTGKLIYKQLQRNKHVE